MIVEALQLLHHVVQLQDRPERLDVERAVHRRRVKLQDCVVLTQCVLHKLRGMARMNLARKKYISFNHFSLRVIYFGTVVEETSREAQTTHTQEVLTPTPKPLFRSMKSF